MILYSRMAVATVFLCAVLTTSASAVTFSLSGNGGLAGSYNFSAGGIDLTVTPGAITIGPTIPEDTVVTQGLVGQYSGGLGISQIGGDSSHEVDGDGVDELLMLAFSQVVQIVSAEFRYVGSNDDFEFWSDSGQDGSLDGDFLWTADIPDSLVYVFGDTYVSNLFGFGATYYNDDYKLYAVTVSPVPLPAALPSARSLLLPHLFHRLVPLPGDPLQIGPILVRKNFLDRQIVTVLRAIFVLPIADVGDRVDFQPPWIGVQNGSVQRARGQVGHRLVQMGVVDKTQCQIRTLTLTFQRDQ